MPSVIDTDAFSVRMRERGVRAQEQLLRITNFSGSDQEQDFTLPANCNGLGRVRHFRRETNPPWPANPLPIEPAARGLKLGSVDEIKAQVFQNAVCNWRCWYCYVDFDLLSGRADKSSWLSADELVELYIAEPDRPRLIDLSGGQPDLVPEWVLWMMGALRRAGVESSTYLWSDDNLSNDYFWRYLTRDEIKLISSYPNYGKVCCIKGYDASSFAFNTTAAPELFERQLQLLHRTVSETAIDLYGYATFTSPTDLGLTAGMTALVDRLQEIDQWLPLRIVPLEIGAFTPTQDRMTEEHTRALAIQHDAIEAWNTELARRFKPADRTRAICDVPLRG